MSIQRSSSKTLVDIGRALLSSASEENREAATALPRVNTKKQIAGTQDSYNFANKNTHRDSLSALVTKESLSALSNPGKVLTEDLSRKLEESKRELDVRNQNVLAIQRNYDGLSAMLKKEKDLGVENKRKVTALSDDNTKLAEENRHLTRRIEDMIERLKRYEHEAEIGKNERSRASQSIEEINLLRGKLQEVQFQFEKKKKEAAELENRNKSLLSQIDKYKNTASNSEDDKQKGLLQLKELRNDLLITQTENDRLHKIIVEYKIKMTDLEKMRGEYESIASYKLEMDKENRDLRKEVSSLRNEINNLKNSNKKLEDSNHTLTVNMKLISDKEEGYKQEIQQLQNSLNSAHDEISQKAIKIQELQASLNEEHLRFLKYNSVVISYDQIISEGGEPFMMKKSEYSVLKSDLTRYKEKTHDYDEMKRKLDKLIKEVERKDAQIDQYVADKEFDTDRNKKLAERVRILEEENKRYAAHSQKLQNALDYKNKNEGLKEGFFNGEIESLRQKLDSNISNLGDINFKQKSAAAEKDQLYKQIDGLKKDLAMKTKENADLMKEVLNLKKKIEENDVEKLGHEILDLRAQLNKLYDLQKVSYRQIEELKSQLEKKDKKIADLGENQFKERMAQLEEREGQVSKAIAKIDHCQSSLIISLSCTECLGSMKNPITMVPCGHNYCEKCLPKTPYCNECGESKGNAKATFRNRLLEEVIAKVAYNQVILEQMKPKTTPTK